MSMTKKVTKWTMVVDGDANGANRALHSVGNSMGSLGKKLKHLGGLIAGAFAADKIIGFGKSVVNAMMEDQASAAVLAKTLKNVTKARQADIDAVEQWIRKTEQAVGVEDDELRPAYSRLLRSTKSITHAQRLLSISLDISAATGKSVGEVANSVSKAYDGNIGALRKLGLSVDQNLIKSKNFAKVEEYLAKVFGGTAATRAQTFAFQLTRIRIAFQNMKEDLGYSLLPALQKMLTWINANGVPALTSFFDALSGKDYKTSGRDSASRVADSWSQKTDPLMAAAGNLGAALRGLATAVGDLFKVFGDGTSAQSGFATFVQMVADLVDDVRYLAQTLGTVAGGIKKVNEASGNRGSDALGTFGSKLKLGPAGASLAAIASLLGIKLPGKAIGGTVNAGASYLVGERGPELFSPTSSGFITANGALGGSSGSGVNVVVNVAGSVIAERDLAVRVRDEMAQLIRRRGLSPSVLGV